MKTVGFPVSHKENEKRRAVVPEDLKQFPYTDYLYIERGYGDVLDISDAEYAAVGCHICSRAESLRQNIICDPKVGDGEYLESLASGQTVFGWVHATQNRDITDKLVYGKLTAYAWEKMFDRGRHVFWQNNELAGEAAVLHAFQCYGLMPQGGIKAAVIGHGNTACGAVRALNMFRADIVQYNRRTEALLAEELGQYDVLVNCVMWDVNRKDHIVSRTDLGKMKKGALIIDVSCDRNGGIETSIPTTIDEPMYQVDGIYHYVVDHTPAIFYRTFSYENSKVIMPYLEQLISENPDRVLCDALIIENGSILDSEILDFQNR